MSKGTAESPSLGFAHRKTLRVATKGAYESVSYQKFKLVMEEGPEADKEYLMEKDRIKVGSAPDNDLRDGTRAVDLAHVVVAALRNPATLDTLAAALAEAGRFDEAVAVMEEAFLLNASAGTTTNEDLDARISLYRAGKAYRQPEMPGS